jgi:hypothetical protein
MTRWIRSYWAEEGVILYWEVGDDGWITRHIELAGPDERPKVASSLAEWMSELEAGRIQQYQPKYGVIAEKPTDWDFPHEDVTQVQYEQIWQAARRSLDTRP